MTVIKSSSGAAGGNRSLKDHKEGKKMNTASCCKAIECCVVTQSNPFLEQSGCRMFDKSSAPSVPFQSRFRTTVVTDAGGNAAIMLRPSVAAAYKVATSFASSVVTAESTFADPNAVNLAGEFRQYRIVSAGVHVVSITGATANSGGMVQVARLTDSTFVGEYKIDLMNYPEVQRGPVYGYDKYHTFTSSGSAQSYNLTTGSALGWDLMVVQVTGAAASTSVLEIEFFYNYELLCDTSSFTSQIAGQAAPHVPKVEALAFNAKALIPLGMNSVEKVTKVVSKHVKEKVDAWSWKDVADVASDVAGVMLPFLL
jgi:hypothetical protein